MKIKKILVAALTCLSGMFTFPCYSSGQTTLPKDKQNGVILHAFCWSFNTIRENMKQIADAGYTMVQTSPANKCFIGEDGGMEIFGKGIGIESFLLPPLAAVGKAKPLIEELYPPLFQPPGALPPPVSHRSFPPRRPLSRPMNPS